ncbi:MAG: PAS domain-containing protein [Deltaproteobacteria bacterium]|nr:PAS domain-containing protein [Deltaproteobacteria bacterium]
MHNRKYFQLVLASMLMISVIATISSGVVISTFMKKRYLSSLSDSMASRLEIAESLFRVLGKKGNEGNLSDFCKTHQKNSENIRYTIVNSTGTVVCDTTHSATQMDNHFNRKEIQEAFLRGTGKTTRYSATKKVDMYYMARKVLIGQKKYVLRGAVSLDKINKEINKIYLRIFLTGLGVLFFAGIIGTVVSLKITVPLKNLSDDVERLSSGYLDLEMENSGIYELEILRNSIDKMAEDLRDKIHTAISRRNELETILSSMSEMVIAIDHNEKIMSFNDSASKHFSLNKNHLEKPIRSVIRNHAIHQFIEEIFASTMDSETEIEGYGDAFSHFIARGRCLKNSEDELTGIVLVFSDVTKIKKLEKMRRNFVANVSHELKTPLTSIRGYTETVLNNFNMDEKAAGFLAKTLSASNRLSSIIEDLLALSRIEEGESKTRMEKEELTEVVREAVDLCEAVALEKSIEIKTGEIPVCQIMAHRNLLVQAISNLISNAIRYSEKDINIEAVINDKTVEISVTDQGDGIEEKYHERIFERFYRIDKARSRKLGGTGLGLAIVKHISLLHGGNVKIKSSPGNGSTFTITVNMA